MHVPGGHTGGATPVPIPNTEVKPSKADATAAVRPWESRTLPGYKKACWSKIQQAFSFSPESARRAWSSPVLAEGGTPETKMDRHPRWSFAPRTRTQCRSYFQIE